MLKVTKVFRVNSPGCYFRPCNSLLSMWSQDSKNQTVFASIITVNKRYIDPVSKLSTFPGLQSLRCLRTLNLRRNALVSNGLPPEMFESEELNTLDLSYNSLTEVPEGICRAKSLLVLNIAHNNLVPVPLNFFYFVTDFGAMCF